MFTKRTFESFRLYPHYFLKLTLIFAIVICVPITTIAYGRDICGFGEVYGGTVMPAETDVDKNLCLNVFEKCLGSGCEDCGMRVFDESSINSWFSSRDNNSMFETSKMHSTIYQVDVKVIVGEIRMEQSYHKNLYGTAFDFKW